MVAPPRPTPTSWRSAGSPYASVPALLADARLASVGELIGRQPGGEVRDETAFAALCDAVRADNPDLMRAVVSLARRDPDRPRAVAGRAAPGPRGRASRRPPT